MVDAPRTNMQILKPTRRPLSAGDVFALRPSERHPYYFGRIIRADAVIEGMPAVLIYLYNAAAEEMLAIPALRRDELLVPPLFTNRLPWRRGYFTTVGTAPLTRWDTLPNHIFRDSLKGGFVDENGRPTPDPRQPVEQFGLHSFRTIDDRVSLALNIPLISDE